MTRAGFLASLRDSTLAAAVPASPLPLPSAYPLAGPTLAVYHLSDEAATAGAVRPDRLLTLKGVRIEIVTARVRIAAAAAAIDAAQAEARLEGAALDARWGLRFSTATDRVVRSMFCDAAGSAGQLDGRPVTFANGRALIAYLTANFGQA